MPETTLLDLISRQADDEERRIAVSTAAQVAAIRGEAAARNEAQIRARVALRAGELETQRAQAVGIARGTARLALLTAREQLIGRVMAAALGRLATTELSAAALAQLIESGSQYLPAGPMIVRCPPRMLAAVRLVVAGRAAVEVVADDDVRAGVRLESPDGRVTVDNTLDGRLRRLYPALAVALLAHITAP